MNEAESNQNMVQTCPQCGATLPSGVLAGLCPACLLKQGVAEDTGPSDAASGTPSFQPPAIEEVARLFPQLEIMAFIGKGGMGAVYQARQPALDRLVALKILPPQAAASPDFGERFNREARALARLNHPNIVAVYEFGQVNGLSYFIMEFVDGLNLRALERAGKLSPREALQIVPQICEALQYAHDEGIVHRDIKPENILMDKKGRVKIADFGIAKILGSGETGLTQTQSVVGTPHYMAPEQMEKPTAVDHRADIFSLGVVFYEMLTGELPLGKFAPPSSRKVEVDVRLDDVVLRALEKDPELRYQHVRQVKTAVDTIAGSAAPPRPATDPVGLAQEILDRDYVLGIRDCLRRSWKLLKANFWPLVGIVALFLALLGLANSFDKHTLRYGANGADTVEVTSVITTLVWGPLMGGLLFYFLKRIRGERVSVETAFCGFSHHFLQLFLAGFVTTLLTGLGFLLLIPGIYLSVAWMFTLPLVMDKQLDFWSAMELSRKVVSRHWFKFLGFGCVLLLLAFAGVLALCVGIFVMTPLILGALMYAYEDVFGGVRGPAPATAATGPFGTVVMPPATGLSATPAATVKSPAGTTATKIGLALLAILVLMFGLLVLVESLRHAAKASAANTGNKPAAMAPAVPVSPSPAVWGPVIEKELQTGLAGTNQFLNLEKQQVLTPPPAVVAALAEMSDVGGRAWQALDIAPESHGFQYIRWLRESDADLMFAEDGNLVGFDGVFAMAHGQAAADWDQWDNLTPDQALAAVALVDWERRAGEASARHQSLPPPPAAGGSCRSAMQMDSREPGGPVVNLLTRSQSVNWFFKTRSGRTGMLQLAGISNHPPVAKIRYRLLSAGGGEGTLPEADRESVWHALNDRLEAASGIVGSDRDRPMAGIAVDAAKAGEVAIVGQALGQISNFTEADAARQEAAILLAKRGMKKPAVEVAKGIRNFTIRNQTLSELANEH